MKSYLAKAILTVKMPQQHAVIMSKQLAPPSETSAFSKNASSKPLEKFTLFQKLPSELQIRIFQVRAARRSQWKAPPVCQSTLGAARHGREKRQAYLRRCSKPSYNGRRIFPYRPLRRLLQLKKDLRGRVP